ncbi:DNA internalization-related competence protein ComEC/Rec2 [Aurantivibrio infirmus]
MKRILFCCFGIAVVGFLPTLLPLSLIICLTAVSLGLLLFQRTRIFAFLLFGFCWGTWCGHQLLDEQLSPDLAGLEIQVRGIISDFPEDRGDSQRFRFSVLDANRIGKSESISESFPQLIQLSWYQHSGLELGQEWTLRVKLRRPRGFVNEGGFDYQRWLLSEGIGATGYVRKSSKNKRLSEGQGSSLQLIRADIKKWLLHSSDSTVKGPIIALAIGDNSQIDSSQWQIFRATGTGHLTAISGLHVGLVAVFGFYLGRWSRAFTLLLIEFISRRLSSRYEKVTKSFSLLAYFLPSIFSIIFALAYASLSGFALSTQRALVMIIVVNIGTMITRKAISFHTLSFAMLAVLIIDPLAAYSLGFWLSFGAVAVLLYCFSNRAATSSNMEYSTQLKIRVWLWSLLKSQWVIFVGLLLPLLVLNQGLSFLAPIANIVAIPLVSTIVIIPLLCAVLLSCFSPVLASYLLQVAVKSLELCWLYLQRLQDSSLSFAWFPEGRLYLFAMVAALFGVLLILSPKGLPGKWLGVVFLVPLLFPISFAKQPLRINILDVGQGLAVVVETRNHTLVYDAGPGFSENFNAGSDILIPFLRKRGIESIDTLIVSHSDNDHAGGVDNLLALTTVEKIISGEAFVFDSGEKNSLLRKDKPEISLCDRDKNWRWDEVEFQLIEPSINSAQNPNSSSYNKNNQSCVLLIRYREDVILIPGDIEAKIERQLLARQSSLRTTSAQDLLPSEITMLLAPHHGSRTSSTQGFVATLSPEWVVYSNGYNNQYGHPHPKVQARYERVNSRPLSTASSGQLEFLWRQEGKLLVSAIRTKKRRYWFDGETVNTKTGGRLED